MVSEGVFNILGWAYVDSKAMQFNQFHHVSPMTIGIAPTKNQQNSQTRFKQEMYKLSTGASKTEFYDDSLNRS